MKNASNNSFKRLGLRPWLLTIGPLGLGGLQALAHSRCLTLDFVDQHYVVDAAGFAVGTCGEVGAANDYDSVTLRGVTFSAGPGVDVADKLLHVKSGEAVHRSYAPV